MSYTQDKKNFSATIAELIEKKKGTTIQIPILEQQVALKYGFGRLTIIRELERYEKLGLIKINDDEFKILGEKNVGRE